jgi:hypothetical protein
MMMWHCSGDMKNDDSFEEVESGENDAVLEDLECGCVPQPCSSEMYIGCQSGLSRVFSIRPGSHMWGKHTSI